ncbi:MAG: LTA synthase family protein [Solobacterium sp.]|nr:LTA synthase family protein [Solobacterium sp.]
MDRNSLIIRYTAELFIVMIAAELVFEICSFSSVDPASLLRTVLFAFTFSAVSGALCSFLPLKAGRTVMNLLGWTMSLYALIQMGMKSMMGNYFSIHITSDMLGKVTEYIIPFFQIIRPFCWLVFAAPALFTVYNHFRPVEKTKDTYASVTLIILALITQYANAASVADDGLESLYRNPKYIEKSLREFGTSMFFFRDIMYGFVSESTLIIEEEPVSGVPEETAEAEPEPEEAVEYHRTVDDTEWIAAMESEEDESVKTADAYLMKRQITDYNEMTGALQGKNLIYIMIEAFDYLALDEELTPTLVKMKEEGWDFTHHYTPKYSCTTGESEFIAEVSLIPESDVCTPNQYAYNTFSNGIFQVFRNAGYYTSAYHNWKDEFYDRRGLYASEGCQVYMNYDDIEYTYMPGWPSDKEMMELTVPEYIDQDKFFTLYVTSSTHFPYDAYSALGEKYLEEINAVHPDYPMIIKRYLSKSIELDHAMEYLLEQLEEHGKLDDTAILFFADHHPLRTDLGLIADYSPEVDRREGLNIDRTPFVIYSTALGQAKLDEVNSTFDILPTVLNLYNMSYDPRIYLGTDYFGEKEKVIYFPDGNWITERGIYYINSDTFEPFENAEEADEEYILRVTNEIENLFTVSSLIYRTDYFAKRPFLTAPDNAKP